MNWKSIDTAPKDGTAFLACWYHAPDIFLIGDCFYDVNRGEFRECGVEIEYGDSHLLKPTHWMKLPEPPEAACVK